MFRGLPTASLTVTDLFSSPFHFSVPHYQRPYSWTTAEAGQLLEDIFEAAGVGSNAEATEPDYFLGNILLLDGSGADLPRGREREPRFFDIVDGQQRLVTLSILLALLRDSEQEKWRWGARNRMDLLIGADAAASRQKGIRFRVELRACEQEFLQHYVQERGASLEMPPAEPASEPEERLLAVRQHFRSELDNLNAAERKQLTSYLCHQCHFVVVLTRDIDRAHRLFTVLNERGRTLQRNDILKAGLLQSVASERVGEALSQWEHAAQLLGPSFETFFSHVYAIHGRGGSNIIAGIRRTVAEIGGAEPFLNTVVVPLAEAYYRLLHAADVNVNLDAQTRRYLLYLGRLADGDWAPSAILALHQYETDPERGKMLIKEIDRLAYLLRLLCVGTGKRKRRFASVVELIKSGAPIRSGEGPFFMSSHDVRNVSYHLRSPYKRDQQVCKLLLLRLNDELSRSTAVLNPIDYSVEHVLPQRPAAASEWRRWYLDGEERESCTESIGNLVVVTKKQNDRARNQEFSRKREIYRGMVNDQPVLPITRDVVDAEVWRAAEIRAREAKLLRLIRDIWGIEARGMPSTRDVA